MDIQSKINNHHEHLHSAQSVCVPACMCVSVVCGLKQFGIVFFASRSVFGFVLKKFSSESLKLLVIDEANLSPCVSPDI